MRARSSASFLTRSAATAAKSCPNLDSRTAPLLLENAMSTVGFVGLGDMGSRMVPHLLRANHRVVVFDVIRDRLRRDDRAWGWSPPDSAAAAAHDADVVISAVMSADIPAAHLGPRRHPRRNATRNGAGRAVDNESGHAAIDCVPDASRRSPRRCAAHRRRALRGRSLVDGAAGWSRRSDGADRADARALRGRCSCRAARLRRGLQTDHQCGCHGGRGRDCARPSI